MATVDSLDIVIQTNVNSAIKSLDNLMQRMGLISDSISEMGKNISGVTKGFSGIQNIGKSIDLSGISKQTKAISESMGSMGAKMAQSMKPVQEETKKISRTFEDVKGSLKNLDIGKSFKVSGGVSDIQKAIQKYENELEKAKLKEQTLSAKDMTDTKGYRDAVADIVKYENVLESLKKQLEEIQNKRVKIDFTTQGIEEVEQSIEKTEESIKKSTGLPKTFYDADAMSYVFGEASKNIESWSQAVEKFGNNAGKSLNESVEKGTETAREKIEELQKMFSESGKDFVFSGNAEQLDQEIQKVKSELDSLYKKQDKFIELGKIDTEPFKTLIRDIENAINRLDILESARPEALNKTLEENAEKARNASNQLKQFEANLQKLRVPPVQEDNIIKLQNALKKTEADLERLRVKLANSLTLGKITANIDDNGYRNLREQIALTEEQAEALRQKISEIGNEPEIGNISGFERLRNFASGIEAAKKAFSSLYAIIKKINNGINSLFAKIGKLTKSLFSLGEAAKRSSGGFNLNLKTILKYGFGIRSVYVLVNKLRNAIKEGMKNLVQYSDETNASISMLKSSIETLKNASAAAFSPLLNAIAPVVNEIIQLCIRATNAINQLFSAIFGNGTWIKAKDQVIDYANSLKSASGAAEKLRTITLGIDELNIISPDNETGGGAGSSLENAADMFETLPIENKFLELAEELKSILSKVFDPIKSAWDNNGKGVMDSWKSALDDVWLMIKEIGRDFLTVWTQEDTVSVFENILTIIDDIEKSISNLANNFRDAWNTNEVGLHIFENIRDVIGTIIENIKHASDSTVEWSANLDFIPVLEAFRGYTESLIPVADSLSGILTDFYEKVLLPLGKWTLEKGLPKLIDVFTEFNKKVDWKKLRDNLAKLWEHLEPFAETVGEGIIIFIERASDLIANFLNSDTFVNFLQDLEDWMDKVTPEDVADGIEKLAKAFAALKITLLALTAISGIATFIITLAQFATAIKTIAEAISVSGIIASLSKFATVLVDVMTVDIGTLLGAGTFAEIGIAIGGALIGGIAAAIFGWNFGQFLYEWAFDEEITMSFKEQMQTIFDAIGDGTIKNALALWGEDIKTGWQEILDWWNDTAMGKWWNEGIVPWFSEDTWNDLWDAVKLSWETSWKKISDWWNNTAIGKWWNENVAPWFTKEKWTTMMTGVVDGFKQTFKNAVKASTDVLNNLIDWINEHLHISFDGFSLGDIEIPAFDFQLFTIPRIPEFAAGGFPEDGLFWKNDNEVITQVAGRAQVLNGTDTYDMIRKASYEGQMQAQDELIRYLSEIAQNTKETAEKDQTFYFGDREVWRASERGRKSAGAAIITTM